MPPASCGSKINDSSPQLVAVGSLPLFFSERHARTQVASIAVRPGVPGLVADRAKGENLRPSATPASPLIVDEHIHLSQAANEHVHSSSIVELPDGTLLAAWFQGSGERDADDVRIMGARKPADTAEWGEPFRARRHARTIPIATPCCGSTMTNQLVAILVGHLVERLGIIAGEVSHLDELPGDGRAASVGLAR